MWQICPKCKKLIPEEAKSCPYCSGYGNNPTPISSEELWCPNCRMFVSPIDGMPGPKKFDLAGYAIGSSIIGGDNYIAWHLLSKQSKKCPKCGGGSLEKRVRSVSKQVIPEDPIKTLKLRLARGEITEEEYQRKRKLL